MIKKQTRKSIERVNANVNIGLNDEQIKIRQENGYTNIVKSNIEKSIGKIIYDNVFTVFNIILFLIASVFLFFIIYLYSTGNSSVVDKHFGFSKFIFLIPALFNLTIGIVQEIRSRNTIRKLKIITEAKSKVIRNGKLETISANNIVIDDIVSLSPGDQATADLIVLNGEISVDESHLTGESDFVKKTPGDKILSGSSIMIGEGKCRVIEVGDDTYAASLSKKAKQHSKHKSELITVIFGIIKILSIALLIITSTVIISLAIKIGQTGADPAIWDGMTLSLTDPVTWARIMVTTGCFGIGMIPSGLVLLTSITLMLSIVYLGSKKTLVQELYSLENLARVDIICLDKTGTLTDGTMSVCDVKSYCTYNDVVDNIRNLIGTVENKNQTAQALFDKFGENKDVEYNEIIPFSSANKSSGFINKNGDKFLLGAPEYLLEKDDSRLSYVYEKSKQGNRVLAFKKNDELLCFFVLEDHIRDSAKDTLKFFDENGVSVKIISGDSPFTVEKIAKECGVKDSHKVISLEGVELDEIPNICEEYTIFARVSPEQKEALVSALREKNHKVAMTGDGVNDILALRKSDLSITFAKATEAAKSCSDIILLDNDFTHLKDVVGEGRRVINNIQRVAVIFLMKSVSIALLALGLIPFAKGQTWYSVENAYLLEIAAIGLGCLLLSFETKKEPIRGSFVKNIYLKAFSGGLLAAIALILPIFMNQVPKALGYTPMVSDGNVKTLMTLLFAIAGIVVTISMCMPINKYRAFCMSAVIIAAIVMGLALPTTFLGGLPTSGNMFAYDTSIGQTFKDSQFMREFFSPSNSIVVQNLINDENGLYIIKIFVLISIPLFLLVSNAINYYIEKDYAIKGKPFKPKKHIGKILLYISSIALMLEGVVTMFDVYIETVSMANTMDKSLYFILPILIVLSSIFISLFFVSGVLGYIIWVKDSKSAKKAAMVIAIIMFVSWRILALVFETDLIVSSSPLITIDSIVAVSLSFAFMIGALITNIISKKEENMILEKQ